MELPNLLNTVVCPLVLALRLNTENADTVVCYSKKSFAHSNQVSTFITLLSSRNLFDVIFIKLNALRRHLFQTGTIRNYYS